MKRLFAIFLLCVSTSTIGGEYLIVNGISKHIGASKNFNEFNPGIGYAWDTNWRWLGDIQPQLGFYENSGGRWTVYGAVGKKLITTSDKIWGIATIGGVAVGYEHTPVMPTAALVGTYRNRHFGVNVLLSVYRDSEDGDTSRGGSIKPLVGLQLVIPLNGRY